MFHETLAIGIWTSHEQLLQERFCFILSLWPYMVPLFLVYAAEYTNLGRQSWVLSQDCLHMFTEIIFLSSRDNPVQGGMANLWKDVDRFRRFLLVCFECVHVYIYTISYLCWYLHVYRYSCLYLCLSSHIEYFEIPSTQSKNHAFASDHFLRPQDSGGFLGCHGLSSDQTLFTTCLVQVGELHLSDWCFYLQALGEKGAGNHWNLCRVVAESSVD